MAHDAVGRADLEPLANLTDRREKPGGLVLVEDEREDRRLPRRRIGERGNHRDRSGGRVLIHRRLVVAPRADKGVMPSMCTFSTGSVLRADRISTVCRDGFLFTAIPMIRRRLSAVDSLASLAVLLPGCVVLTWWCAAPARLATADLQTACAVLALATVSPVMVAGVAWRLVMR